MSKCAIPLVWQIMLGLVLGVIVGAILNHFPTQQVWLAGNVLQPAGDIFIKLMQMIVVPLVFACMVVGIAGQGSNQSLGRVGVKAMTYFMAITTLAIIWGLLVGNLLQPGHGTDVGKLQAAALNLPATASQQGLSGLLLSIIPDNIVGAMAQGKMLPVLFFAIVFGIALNQVEAAYKDPVVAVLRGVSQVMFRITAMVMAYSPIGIFGMISVVVSTYGFASLLPLAKLIGATYFAIILFGGVVLASVARYVGVNLLHLARHIKDELILAFSSASSLSVMPQLIQKMESYGVPPTLVRFVVPLGYSFNLDGGSIFLGLGTLFVAQLYNIDIPLSQQLLLVVTMVLTSKGAAGVPGLVFVVMSATLTTAGLPLEGLAFFAGVYRIMDMATTTLNVLGNALAPLVIARWELGKARGAQMPAASGVATTQ
ncbi:cation:dicarboxylate symporter family transporter [Pseudomonas sp. NPDC012596]|uniref:cation:dicarboxylate symporter family transporter n=1 Tax=Pseudomonas sp. NPDC012596 TaxID=3364419 RepID=UPI00369E475F